MNFDQSAGIIEMFMDSLEVTDEGTFTFNLVDGKAKGATSLVLIGDGKIYIFFVYIHSNWGTDEAFIGKLLLLAVTFYSTEGQQKPFLDSFSSVLFRPMMIWFPASCYLSVVGKKMTACSRTVVSHLLMAFSAFQNSGSFRRNLNLRDQNGSENKVLDQMSLHNLDLQQCV